MKRTFIIVAASVAVLALIVVMGIYAQGGSKSSNNVANEQNLPDNCKGCPSASTCLDANAPTDTTASACKATCANMKSTCDKSKCANCDKRETCAKSKECPHKTATGGCDKKSDATGCTRTTDCKKECPKK